MQNNQVYFKDIRNKIIEQIELAESEILIAVAWFTDEKIISALENCAKRNIQVKIIFFDDKINRKDLFKDLFHLNAQIKFTPKLMHNKFCIIDKSVVINGSYNWTYSARTNHENITVTTNKNLTHEFITEFNNIFDTANEIDFYFKSIESKFKEYLQAQPFPISFPLFIFYENTYKLIQELVFENKKDFYFILIKNESDFTTYHQYIYNRIYNTKKYEFARIGLQIFKEIYDYNLLEKNSKNTKNIEIAKEDFFQYFTNSRCLVVPPKKMSHSKELYFIDQSGNIISKKQYFKKFKLHAKMFSIDYVRTNVLYDMDLNEINIGKNKITLVRDNWICTNETFKIENQNYIFYGLLDNECKVLLPNIFHKLVEENNDKIIFESYPIYGKGNHIKTLENIINTPIERQSSYTYIKSLALKFEYDVLSKKLTQISFNPLSTNYYYLTDDNGIYADFYKLKLFNLKTPIVEEMKNYFFRNKLLSNKTELEKLFNEKIKLTQQNNENNSKSCYIATLAYQNIDHPQVEYLRKFRDDKLNDIYIGRAFIKFYYKFSPQLVKLLGNKTFTNYILRKVIDLLIKILRTNSFFAHK